MFVFQKFDVAKYHWSESKIRVLLVVRMCVCVLTAK